MFAMFRKKEPKSFSRLVASPRKKNQKWNHKKSFVYLLRDGSVSALESADAGAYALCVGAADATGRFAEAVDTATYQVLCGWSCCAAAPKKSKRTLRREREREPWYVRAERELASRYVRTERELASCYVQTKIQVSSRATYFRTRPELAWEPSEEMVAGDAVELRILRNGTIVDADRRVLDVLPSKRRRFEEAYASLLAKKFAKQIRDQLAPPAYARFRYKRDAGLSDGADDAASVEVRSVETENGILPTGTFGSDRRGRVIGLSNSMEDRVMMAQWEGCKQTSYRSDRSNDAESVEVHPTDTVFIR